jgi:hypothetical protein
MQFETARCHGFVIGATEMVETRTRFLISLRHDSALGCALRGCSSKFLDISIFLRHLLRAKDVRERSTQALLPLPSTISIASFQEPIVLHGYRLDVSA